MAKWSQLRVSSKFNMENPNSQWQCGTFIILLGAVMDEARIKEEIYNANEKCAAPGRFD